MVGQLMKEGPHKARVPGRSTEVFQTMQVKLKFHSNAFYVLRMYFEQIGEVLIRKVASHKILGKRDT